MWCTYKEWNIIRPQKEGNLAICDNMKNPEGVMLKVNCQTKKTNFVWSHLYRELKHLNWETENKLMAAGVGDRRE